MKYVGLQTSSGQPTKTSKSRTKSRPDSSKNRSSAPKKKREKPQSKTHPENKPDKQEVRLVFMSNRLLLKIKYFSYETYFWNGYISYVPYPPILYYLKCFQIVQ